MGALFTKQTNRKNDLIENQLSHPCRTQDSLLHIIMMYSNPCQYINRKLRAQEYVERMSHVPFIKLYIVEVIYPSFHSTNDFGPSDSHEYVSLTANHLIWHKENAINVAIHTLFPSNWKYMAWIDADIEFENPHWVIHTITSLTILRYPPIIFSL
jgi:hypothetical protein